MRDSQRDNKSYQIRFDMMNLLSGGALCITREENVVKLTSSTIPCPFPITKYSSEEATAMIASIL